MIRFVILAAVAFCLTEAGFRPHIDPHNGYESEVNRNNARRQLALNDVADGIGAGTGTARKDGVPGTPLGVTGHDRYSYGHGRGYGRYGTYGAYGGNYGGHGYGGYGGY